jgi:hypothetical protein
MLVNHFIHSVRFSSLHLLQNTVREGTLDLYLVSGNLCLQLLIIITNFITLKRGYLLLLTCLLIAVEGIPIVSFVSDVFSLLYFFDELRLSSNL